MSTDKPFEKDCGYPIYGLLELERLAVADNVVDPEWQASMLMRNQRTTNLKGVKHSRHKPRHSECVLCKHYSIGYNECTHPKITKMVNKTRWTNTIYMSYAEITSRVIATCKLLALRTTDHYEMVDARQKGDIWHYEVFNEHVETKRKRRVARVEYKYKKFLGQSFDYNGRSAVFIRDSDGILKIRYCVDIDY